MFSPSAPAAPLAPPEPTDPNMNDEELQRAIAYRQRISRERGGRQSLFIEPSAQKPSTGLSIQ
jgi:hypothetical protein